MHQDALDGRLLPHAENILRELPQFLQQPGPSDTVILFVAMHGVCLRDPVSGNLEGYLVPADVDPQNLKETLIPLGWLKSQLQKSRAQSVVLLIDACHAGSVRTSVPDDTSTLTSRNIEDIFQVRPTRSEQPKQNLYTLVSCREDERSAEWGAIGHGLFAYWLCQGLDGAADLDGDAIVSMDELFRFVELQVPRTAASLRNKDGTVGRQHPQRFLLGSAHHDLRLFPLHPEPAKQALDRLTGLIDTLLRNHIRHLKVQGENVPRISVLEFASRTPRGRELRGPLGSLGIVARDYVETGLIDRIDHTASDETPYRVVLEESLKPTLRDFTLKDVLAGKLSDRPQESSDPRVDALVLGTFQRAGHEPGMTGPDRLLFQAQLFDLRETQPIGQIHVTMLVDAELWTLLPGSFDHQQPPKDRETEDSSPSGEGLLTAIAPSLTPASWNQGAKRRHPLRDSKNRTLSVAIRSGTPDALKQDVNWHEENPHDANLLAFSVRRGEELEILIENPGDSWLALIASVDGHNVIGRKRTIPSKSRYWLIPPRGHGIIDQWLETPDEGTADGNTEERTQQLNGRRFVVTSPPESVAGQQGFTNDLGEIRLLVYDTVLIPPSSISLSAQSNPPLGIGEGSARKNIFPVYRDRQIDLSKPLAAYTVHYTRPPDSIRRK